VKTHKKKDVRFVLQLPTHGVTLEQCTKLTADDKTSSEFYTRDEYLKSESEGIREPRKIHKGTNSQERQKVGKVELPVPREPVRKSYLATVSPALFPAVTRMSYFVLGCNPVRV